ncbi:hypothetical protein PV328_011873 [Microctonus aethiopoides]|uniref:Uncharacterized protein n=1 Tax=Microctonus aethiopoides TaxID=144406 RepID=A0AA39C478_9HYME|nr:hypothetical protein PV328_011873 [Microctonus aethiopoides]
MAKKMFGGLHAFIPLELRSVLFSWGFWWRLVHLLLGPLYKATHASSYFRGIQELVATDLANLVQFLQALAVFVNVALQMSLAFIHPPSLELRGNINIKALRDGCWGQDHPAADYIPWDGEPISIYKFYDEKSAAPAEEVESAGCMSNAQLQARIIAQDAMIVNINDQLRQLLELIRQQQQQQHPQQERPQQERPQHPQQEQQQHPQQERPQHPQQEQQQHPQQERPQHPQQEQQQHPQQERPQHPQQERPQHPQQEQPQIVATRRKGRGRGGGASKRRWKARRQGNDRFNQYPGRNNINFNPIYVSVIFDKKGLEFFGDIEIKFY